MFTLNGKGRLLTANRPLVMGILNRTPDSFYSGSRVADDTHLIQQADKMICEGADILDIGGQSTRPHAEQLGEEEELRRVVGAIQLLHREWPDVPLSVDTWFSRVAREAVAAGASMVNDISGGTLDPEMLATVGSLRVPYICMHMKGTPATMNNEAVYEDVVREVLDFFIRRMEDCRRAGIHDVILDPGFGFAKTATHNFRLLRHLSVFRITGKPILLGVSRKSTIYRTLGITPEEALNGTTVLHTIGLLNGADILRVHDVKEAREAILLLEALK
ncbi:dihydropteroate synthase [Puia dinghuensis]|uniref:dihydropteroate synthase n=1 Tax=Puia dinghuensis TaxID=1792502 RepID=A0A8J2U7C6_9BACT|nr:dihydropteroate synthase [Puia dinghuensis]GGA83484.1 dihydropteroate synthase [Puia dinghuensis]